MIAWFGYRRRHDRTHLRARARSSASGSTTRTTPRSREPSFPAAPLFFAKYTTALIGPGDPIVIPPIVTRCDYEAELGVVIGATVKGVSKENALEAVAGYVVANDVSARDLQFSDGQWTRGKSPDTFCPVGPLVPAAEVPDPHALAIRAILNGETMQDSTTANLIFGIDEVISYASQTSTLEAGDLILTGTPAGRRRLPRPAAAAAARATRSRSRSTASARSRTPSSEVDGAADR